MLRHIIILIFILSIAPVTFTENLSPKDIIEKRCSVCHSTNRVYDTKKSKTEWETTFDRMTNYGAKFGQDEREAVIKYLSEKNIPGDLQH
ncbi:MAG: hypothetical protein A2Y97_00090 [Nitrospirae bacterium RBG_13_39_12]|nr:MAG: hypothetical protein A2Y97_00090 [Nitrospirae bacterium RBG_13_39_12]